MRKIRNITGFLGKILATHTMKGDQILENSKTLARLSRLNNGGDSELLNLLKAKYCSVDHPTIVQWKPGQSHSWQAMLKIREEVEQEIFWKTNRGNSSFWFDKWNEHGPLYELLENTLIYQHITIKDVFQHGHCNLNALNPQPRITSNISLPILPSTWQIILTIFLSGPLLNLGSFQYLQPRSF